MLRVGYLVLSYAFSRACLLLRSHAEGNRDQGSARLNSDLEEWGALKEPWSWDPIHQRIHAPHYYYCTVFERSRKNPIVPWSAAN